MDQSHFNWAILGPGAIAHKFAQGLKAAPGGALYAVASRDMSRALGFASEYGAPVVLGSYLEAVQDKAVDAVYIATPHPAHYENAILCLEHGKSVLCEKPMSINAHLERRMVDAARANGVFLMEAMWTRFLPAVAKARELLAAGAIGEPNMLTADFSFSVEFNPASRLFDPALGGGALLDVGIYVMAFSSMIFGPKPINQASFARLGATGVDERAAMLLEYPGCKLSSLTCGTRSQGAHEARITGTQGHIELSPFWKAQSLRVVRGDAVEELSFPFRGNGYEYEAMEVMGCVRKGLKESPVMPLDESIAIMETMDAFRESWGLRYPQETAK